MLIDTGYKKSVNVFIKNYLIKCTNEKKSSIKCNRHRKFKTLKYNTFSIKL